MEQRRPNFELEIHFFGAPEIRLGGTTITALSPKTRALLCYLCVTKQTHLRTTLASLLWGDMPEKNARSNLRKSVQQLRAALPDHLNIDAHSIGLCDGESTWVDVIAFEEGIKQPAVEEAVNLYRGDFLAGFFVRNAPDFETWQLAQQARLREAMLGALHAQAERLIAQNEIGAAIVATRRIVELEPWREEAHRQLMQLLAQNGQRTAALHQYEECRKALLEEMAVEPSAATHALYERLQHQEPNAGPDTRRFVTTTDYTLVGREAEWAALREKWRSLNQPHFVCIAGDAGIGKTRLAEELLMRAEREGQRAVRTRSHALEGRLAYAPVADWLRSTVLVGGLSALDDVWLTEIARLLPELLVEHPELPKPEPITDNWQRKRLFEALAHAFAQVRLKLLLVLDDLQWCDNDTLEWLHYLLESATVPLLLVGTLRSGEIDDEHPLHHIRQQLHRMDRCSDVALNALTPAATATLAEQVAGNDLSSKSNSMVAESVFEDTAGNPLFVIETVRAASGVEEEVDAPAATESPVAAMPPKMYRVIQSRLMQLSPDAQKVAQVGATIGREFDVALLAHAAEATTDSVLLRLDELWQKRIVREVDSIHFDFSHDRIRDVAYAEIRPIQKQLIHKKIVDALEGIYDSNRDDVAGELAKHCYQAKMMTEALAYYQQAANVGKGLYAFHEVAYYLESALTVADMSPPSEDVTIQTLDLLYQLGAARIVTHDFGSEPVTKAWDRAYALAKEFKEPFYLCRSVNSVSMYSRNHGRWRNSRKYDEEALTLLPYIQDSTITSCQVLNNYGGCLYHMGEPVESFRYFEKALKIEEELSNKDDSFEWVNYTKRIPKTATLIRWAKSLTVTGYIDQARKHLDTALQLEKSLSELERDFASLDFPAMLYSFLRDVPKVEVFGQNLMVMSDKREFPFYERAGRMFVAWAEAHNGGDALACVQAVRESVDGHRNRGIRMFEPYWRGLLAETLALAGEFEEALSEAQDGFNFANECGNTYWNAQLLNQIGDYETALAAPNETVESYYQQAIDVARQQQAKLLELRATVSLCRLWQKQGRIHDAHEMLANIYGWFTEGFDTVDLKEAKALLDDLYVAD